MNLELNTQQQQAATFDQGHVLVLAGAGTGKTRTIIARAAHLIDQGVAPNRILLLTFTRRAAREMVNRLEDLVGSGQVTLTAGTFHHFCLMSMRRMPRAFGVEKATIIDRDDQNQLMRLVRGEFREKGEQLPKAAELVRICSYARNTVQPMEAYLEKHGDFEAAMAQKIVSMAAAYDARKRQNNYLDYDDILFLFAKQLHEDTDVRNRLRTLYDHVLVDEMQDTNPLQWLILDGLRDPAQLFCVGDDAQSIYAFRGADFSNVHHFTDRVPNSTVLRLEQNFRSTQDILDLSNWLLYQSPIDYDKRLTAHRTQRAKPKLIDFESDFEEARWIAGDLTERQEDGADWRDHMIITRTGFGARAVESFLVEKKIPYRFIGGTSLLDAAHVKDLLCLVRAAISHQDELAWARYLTMWPRIGDATAARLISAMAGADHFAQAMARLEDKLKGRPDIAGHVHRIADHLQDPKAAIVQAGKALKPLMKLRYTNWENRQQDIKLLARLAEKHRSILAFIETYTLDPISTTDAQRLAEEDAVILTTVHSAKGTEAPVCYIIRVEPGMYPHQRSIGDRDQEEEERRILYVAMTRAQNELILTRTLSFQGRFRLPYGGRGGHQSTTAYFFEDLGDDLVDWENIDYQMDQRKRYDYIHPWRQ